MEPERPRRRIRASTLLLAAVFVVTLVLYLFVRPDPTVGVGFAAWLLS